MKKIKSISEFKKEQKELSSLDLSFINGEIGAPVPNQTFDLTSHDTGGAGMDGNCDCGYRQDGKGNFVHVEYSPCD